MTVKEARAAYNAALEHAQECASAVADMADDADDADVEVLERAFDDANTSLRDARSVLERIEKADEVRQLAPVVVPDPEQEKRTPNIKVGEEAQVYHPDNARTLSFFRDVWKSKIEGDFEARERLVRHEARVADNSTSSTDGGGFIPPVYLGDLYAPLARAGRPFADIVPKLPLPSKGMTMTLPKVTTGVSASGQTSENTELSSTAIVEAVVTVEVNTIGGVVDTSLQLLERSDPPIDAVIYNDLRGAYDVTLDTYCLSGTGTPPQHMGIRAVTGNLDVTYSDSTPTAAELLVKIYDAIQQVYSNRFRPANVIVMHPRRAAWLASSLSSTFPLFQQGGLNQAVGTQNDGFAGMFAGLNVVLDPNIGTTYSQSGSTNEDEIYVLHINDLYLAEGPFRTDTFMEPGSANLTARFRGFAYSAFFSERYPKSIADIVGGGLAAPSF